MDKYKKFDKYLIFDQISMDSIGTNYRAGEMEDNKVRGHKLLTEVHPFLFRNVEVWNRINILLEGIKKSNIPSLYSPEKIIQKEDKVMLVFPYMMKGKTFEQILEDSLKKNIQINFDLAFSIAMAIADIIDMGSAIVVSGQKSFHGFLTPDNIFIDYDGKILLKNYGIYPFLEKDEKIFQEIEKKYGSWVTPEFLKREKIVPQSDIFHLGYLIYRMLTGKYFSFSQKVNFESKLASISFTSSIPSGDKTFLMNTINLFKKTLNPNPSTRFSNIKEFKDYISSHFHIDELSSVTFNLAYFMHSIYLEEMERETKLLKEESAYTIPTKEEIVEKKVEKDAELVDSLLSEIEEKKTSKKKYMFPLIIFLAVVVIGVVFYIYNNLSKKAISEQKKMEERLLIIQQKQREREKTYREELEKIQEKTATTEEEQKTKDEQIKKLEDWKLEQVKKEKDRIKKIEEERKKKEEEERLKKEEEERLKKEEEERKKKEEEELRKKKEEEEKKRLEELKKVKPGQVVALSELSKELERTKYVKLVPSSNMRKKYSGKTFNVPTNILIDENGDVLKVKMFGNAPSDIRSIIKSNVLKWKYIPPEKDNVKVKVWKPFAFNVQF